MENKDTTLAEKFKLVSGHLLDNKYLLEVLGDMYDDGKTQTLVDTLSRNNKIAFSELEKCRSIIGVID